MVKIWLNRGCEWATYGSVAWHDSVAHLQPRPPSLFAKPGLWKLFGRFNALSSSPSLGGLRLTRRCLRPTPRLPNGLRMTSNGLASKRP